MTRAQERREASGGGRGVPTTLCVVLCLLTFAAGSLFSNFVSTSLPGATGPSIVEEPRDAQGEAARRAALLEHPGGAAQQRFSTFEETIEASGMLAHRPPLAAGESGHSFYTVAPYQLLSWYPRAYLFPSFVPPDKVEHIRRLAEARLAPSMLAFKKGDTEENTKDVRTSLGTFLSRGEDPEGVLAWLEDKIAVVTGIPAGHGEPFNVLRYENGQHYDSHFDSFSEEEYGPQPSQRIATMLMYLSEVEEGGETVFLLEGKHGEARLANIDYKACDTGIKVKPRQGDALLFWNTHVNGSLDKRSLHGSCPTTKGVKWTATKWMRNKCFMRDCVEV